MWLNKLQNSRDDSGKYLLEQLSGDDRMQEEEFVWETIVMA